MKPGFTILETLAAVFMISIGLLAAIMMESKAIGGGALADRRTVAVFLAESKIDQISALPVSQMPAELRSGGVQVEERLNRLGLHIPEGQDANEVLYIRRTVLRQGCPTSQSNEVEVEISWPGAFQPLRYVSVLAAF